MLCAYGRDKNSRSVVFLLKMCFAAKLTYIWFENYARGDIGTLTAYIWNR
jgi:hypothetical protein